uniref:Protease Do-like 14 n=1 Tax=Aegilops tauschii TaxID=37682 RepID=N1QXC2_AEGTA
MREVLPSTNPATAGQLVSKAGLERSMTKNKRRLMRGDEEQQRPYKRATRPSDTKLRECTGICIETSCSDSEATILTSRRLVPPTWPASLTIKVRLPNDQIVTGWIEDPGIYVDFFIVNIKEVSRVDATSLDRDIQFEPHTKAAAVCRCFSSGFLTVTSGLNLASPTSETIAGIGGPLVDFDGNFVGMNSSRTKMEKTAYVRRKQILRFLVFHGMVRNGVFGSCLIAHLVYVVCNILPLWIYHGLDATSIARLSESRKGALSEQLFSLHVYSPSAGDTKLRECTGICIESSCPGVTSFLTSINLIPLTWRASKITKNLKIKVRLLNDETVTGWIADPEIYVDFFIVNVAGVNATHVSLDRDMQFEPYRKVAAVCRNFNSGLLMDTSGVDLASPSALPDQTMFSTCQIDKVGIGGPLVDFDGNFVGMNCSCTKERKTPYVRRAAILRFLGVNGMVSVKDVVDDATRAFLKTMAEHHVTIFKEDLQKNLLAQIEVCLPNKFRVVGILKGYNLHYNVALVDIIGCWDPHAIQISGRPVTSSMDVIAVGCLFAYRKLMAVEGKVLIGKQSKFDCTELCVSTCKITKAGIGGPLIDTDGNFVGMNFYDEEETPFLPRDLICRLLLNVNKEWASADDTIMECDKNRWLLPGGTHRNTDGNRWPLPKPRLVGVRDVCL